MNAEGPTTGAQVWRIDHPVVTRAGDKTVISAATTIPGLREPLEFRVTGVSLSEARADAFLAATLLPAMKAGARIEIAGSTSPRLRASIETIQDIHTSWNWDPALRRVAVHGPQRQPPITGRGAASFFSGGVDSFYTALKRDREIDALVLVHGFDIPLADLRLRGAVSTAMRGAAAELGKPLIEVETNIRSLAELHDMSWNWYHGAALGSVALLLAPRFERVFIPSSYPYFWLEPWGSHPLLDPLWSTESLDVVHDGCEATRTAKVRRIAASDAAVRWLRVCWEHPDGAHNCGRCEKCVRTMVNLEITGALDRCGTFETPLDLAVVSRTELRDDSAHMFAEDNLRAALAERADPALVAALRTCVSRRYYRGVGKLLRGDVVHRVVRRLARSGGAASADRQSAYAFSATV